MRKFLIAGLLALCTLPALADEAREVATDPALEKRVLALSEELRCLVCQNQTIAESHAELAIDLRNQVREQLAAGKTEKEVTEYMVARYGDFVLYRPPVKRLTWLLWFGPFVLMLGGVLVLWRKLARREVPAADLTPEEQARAARLLDATNDKKEDQ